MLQVLRSGEDVSLPEGSLSSWLVGKTQLDGNGEESGI